ncbi:similar to Saccharomyces cerevisiae YBL066C SEF1 Putative transcription factor, has homolog in Kluyveromyces lactis [Maudiozyma saulgeensis]|uniref:Similar to Saccharomyces cerevisiae YBL066C SEF1 Putative transcription factor, has homolog in Kluyveromyces lactis n=1 Tax=Maudiozyma saulgeensis TaxID=1789683 RepID=A0A1X7R546_9SACH|nr:similar to Saccharomyces cerevisiae YBL066C SEF1 Putative transcription factor, has homolog in Kluyveromyces lactis [Kazachstania saulgeensis]
MKEELKDHQVHNLKKQKLNPEIKSSTVSSQQHIPPILPMSHNNGMITKNTNNHNHNTISTSQSAVTGAAATAAAANHRPVTSCSHCRQHKIKCDAHQNFPAPCSRCTKYGLHCEVDPQFKPKKGSQLQMMRRDLDDLKIKVNYLLSNENILFKHINENPIGRENLLSRTTSNFNTPKDLATQTDLSIMSPYQSTLDQSHTPLPQSVAPNQNHNNENSNNNPSTKISVQTYLVTEPALLNKNHIHSNNDLKRTTSNNSNVSTVISKSKQNKEDEIPNTLQLALQRGAQTDENVIAQVKSNSNDIEQIPRNTSNNINNNRTNSLDGGFSLINKKSPVVLTTETLNPLPSPYTNIDEFVLGDVHLSIAAATRLHTIFVKDYLPYFPIMYTNSVTELYSQSQLLFWTVMLTACLSDPEPSLYTKLSVVIKQLAIETCWMRTPRSTHITQALLILCIWPLPNQKVLDDCSYRFVGLAKSLSYQLGLHRGEFITEFTRSQTSMPNAEKWRTRTWLGIYFAELCWASILGLPPTSKTDYLVEKALKCDIEEDPVESFESTTANKKSKTKSKPNDKSKNSAKDGINAFANDIPEPCELKLPSRFKKMIGLSNFQLKLCNVMGSSVSSPDGLIGPKERAGVLSVLNKELDSLANESGFEENIDVHIYYLYVRLMVYCFAFFPETPIEDQSKYITDSYLCATKIVTLLTNLLEVHQLISLPIFIRQSVTFSALILFKLQLTPLLPNQYLNSARQSIVTVHRLFRNQLTAWATVENDISRTASMLEKLNLVLITHSEVFIEESGVISRMRSHLTGSLFYDLVWCVHEARRREMDPKYNQAALKNAREKRKLRNKGKNVTNNWDKKLYPLPLYNHITRDDFKTITQTTPGGTTVTTLVPTKTALKHAEEMAKTNDKKGGSAIEINGIPLFMLDETGSVKIDDVLARDGIGLVSSHTAANGMQHQYSGLNTSKHESQSSTSFGTPNSDYGTYYHGSNNSNDSKNNNNGVLSYGSNRSSIKTESLFSSKNNDIVNGVVNIPIYNKNVQTEQDNRMQHNNGSFPNQGNSNSNNLNAFLNKKQHYSKHQIPNDNKNSQPNNTNSNNIPKNKHNGKESFINPINDFFQQQGAGWTEGNLSNDDFFGWFDMNMGPEF